MMRGDFFGQYNKSRYIYIVEYKASLDWSAKLVTAFVTVLFVGILTFHVRSLLSAVNAYPISIAFGFTSVLLIGIYGFCYLNRPLKYIIDSDKIIIKRNLRDKVIPLTSIKGVYSIKKGTMGWVWKTFGNGGLFGFYGGFRSDRYGDMTWYATRRSNYVMLETYEDEKIVLTPDDLGMVKEIKKVIEQ